MYPEKYMWKHIFLSQMRKITICKFCKAWTVLPGTPSNGQIQHPPPNFLGFWRLTSSWSGVAGRCLKKINKFGADWEGDVAGFVSEDILLSEIFHQINCQGSNSPSRTQKHVRTSFACRQRDARFFTQMLLNLLACRSIKTAKLYKMPFGSSPPPAERNLSSNSVLLPQVCFGA